MKKTKKTKKRTFLVVGIILAVIIIGLFLYFGVLQSIITGGLTIEFTNQDGSTSIQEGDFLRVNIIGLASQFRLFYYDVYVDNVPYASKGLNSIYWVYYNSGVPNWNCYQIEIKEGQDTTGLPQITTEGLQELQETFTPLTSGWHTIKFKYNFRDINIGEASCSCADAWKNAYNLGPFCTAEGYFPLITSNVTFVEEKIYVIPQEDGKLTCNDNIKNQDETGIDCGGICIQGNEICGDGIDNNHNCLIDEDCTIIECALNDDCDANAYCSNEYCKVLDCLENEEITNHECTSIKQPDIKKIIAITLTIVLLIGLILVFYLFRRKNK